MSKPLTASIVLCIGSLQSVVVCIGNSLTIYVFWIHRNKLKRTSFLLINLAVADLFVGVTDLTVTGTLSLPQMTGLLDAMANKTLTHEAITSVLFQAMFSSVSVFFLTIIAMERAFAIIWPRASTPSSKHQRLHPKCYYRLGHWNNCGCSVFACFIRPLRIPILCGSLLLYHSCVPGFHQRVISRNTTKT